MDACGVNRRPRLEVRVIALKDWYFIKMSLKTDSFYSESMFANRCIITHLIKKTLKKTRKKKFYTKFLKNIQIILNLLRILIFISDKIRWRNNIICLPDK